MAILSATPTRGGDVLAELWNPAIVRDALRRYWLDGGTKSTSRFQRRPDRPEGAPPAAKRIASSPAGGHEAAAIVRADLDWAVATADLSFDQLATVAAIRRDAVYLRPGLPPPDWLTEREYLARCVAVQPTPRRPLADWRSSIVTVTEILAERLAWLNRDRDEIRVEAMAATLDLAAPALPADLIGVGRAAALLHVSTETVRRYVARGALMAYPTPLGVNRFREAHVLALIEGYAELAR